MGFPMAFFCPFFSSITRRNGGVLMNLPDVTWAGAKTNCLQDHSAKINITIMQIHLQIVAEWEFAI
jgi:hypothetical protein